MEGLHEMRGHHCTEASYQLFKFPQPFEELRKWKAGECFQVFVCGFRRVFQSCAESFYGVEDLVLCQIKLIDKEVVWMLSLNAEDFQLFVGEVTKVHGDDRPSFRDDGCGENMSVVRIRQFKAVDEMFVSVDKAIGNGLIHQVASSRQFFRC